MQQTPKNPTLQSEQILPFSSLHVTQGYPSLFIAETHQGFKQGACVANVYAATCFNPSRYSEPSQYQLRKVNICILLLTQFHVFFSLRVKRDFTIEAGAQPLLEAEQLNFWKYPIQDTNKNFASLEPTQKGSI